MSVGVSSSIAITAGTGPIYLDNVACSGNEERLIDCLYDPHTEDCDHTEDIGIRCQGESHTQCYGFFFF